MIGRDRNITHAIKGSPGYSIVEFLIAMLILALVSLSWLTIIQVQSANRESYRREAVERLAGMMDVISQQGLAKNGYRADTVWRFDDGLSVQANDARIVNPLFRPTESSIGYRLRVKRLSAVSDLISRRVEDENKERCVLTDTTPVLVGELFERSGTLDEEEYSDIDRKNVGDRIWRVAIVLRFKN